MNRDRRARGGLPLVVLGALVLVVVAIVVNALFIDAPIAARRAVTQGRRPLEPVASSTPVVSRSDWGADATLTAGLPLRRTPVLAKAVSVSRMLEHTAKLEAFGVRTRGTATETVAAEYVKNELIELGYTPRVQEFRLPEGTMSRNVIVRREGSDPRVIVLGAHFDSRAPSPGANDDAVGCGLLLEFARVLRENQLEATIVIVFFGSEEFKRGAPEHHLGSRHYVATLPQKERDLIAGMMSLDVLAVGAPLHTRTMGKGPLTMSDTVLAEARRQGLAMTYLKDPGETGWSDHEPFELAGIPAVWIERPKDPEYHREGDTTAHLEPARLREVSDLVAGVLEGLDMAGLDALAR